MTPMIIWFCLALVVTFVEMFLVTFYLLAVAAGMCAGGIAAYLGSTTETQITAAGITTIIVACFSFMLRKKLRRTIDVKLNNMDKGERVQVVGDKIASDGSARVVYRGTDWVAYSTQGPLSAGIYLIDRIDGTRIVLEQKVGDASQVYNSTKTVAQEASVEVDKEQGDLDQSSVEQGANYKVVADKDSTEPKEDKGDTAVKF